MNKSKKILIIGGTACGPKAAARARRCDPHARITIIEQGTEISAATCGFPYYISGVIKKRDNLLVRGPDYFKNVMNIDVLLQTKAQRINRRNHSIEVINLKTQQTISLGYDKLVIATGSIPLVPDIEGKKLKGIFTLSRLQDAQAIKRYVNTRRIRKAVIVGAGFIGLEMAEALVELGIKVEIIEALDWIMPAFLDFEMASYLEKHLLSKGIRLYCGQRVTGFRGDKNGIVNRVIMGNDALETQLVLLAVGTRPNVQLARDAGLTIGTRGGIEVNEYLQTNDPDIYAGGDCVENLHRITGKKVLVPLGSTANKHGRVIGTNLTDGSDVFPGVMGTGIAKAFDYNVGRVGLTEQEARSSGYSVVTALVLGNEHATYYPGSKQFLLKLIADKKNNRILGAQMVGPGNVDKRLDVLVAALSFGATLDDLANLDLGYAPPYNGAIDPVHHAVNTVRNKQGGLAQALTAGEVKAKLDRDDDFILLDVRSQAEWEENYIEARQSRLIPLNILREKTDVLPRNKEIVTLCHSSVRAYQAQRILDGAGFNNVKFMDGSMVAWPYETSKSKSK
jgi:NADPH-dependent 2,4-dienoyl-CoA reductase/sulfur reductase-like enzyme/rhodanese-related sulfurtransferase